MRPLKYGEEMIQVNMRLPKSRVKEVQDMVSDYLRKYEVGYEIANSSPKTPKPDFINTPAKPKWAIDAENRNKRTNG